MNVDWETVGFLAAILGGGGLLYGLYTFILEYRREVNGCGTSPFPPIFIIVLPFALFHPTITTFGQGYSFQRILLTLLAGLTMTAGFIALSFVIPYRLAMHLGQRTKDRRARSEEES